MRILISIFFLLFGSISYAQSLPPLGISDEGGSISRPVFQLDCVGSNISCSKTATKGTITIADNSVTASALAANGTNCSAGNYPLGVDASGNAENCTSATGGAATNVPWSGVTDPSANEAIVMNAYNNTWTSTTGYNLWTAANTSGDYFKLVNTGAMGANGSIVKIANTGNPTGGSVLQLENTDTDMKTITAPNFTLTQAGTLTTPSVVSELTGNASTATALAANGANCSAGQYPLGVDASGAVESCTTVSGGSATSIAYDAITSPSTNSGIYFGAFSNIWTSTTGTHTWTSAATADSFKIVNTSTYGNIGSTLKLSQTGNVTGGSVLLIENSDTDSNSIRTSPNNFSVSQAGNVTMAGDLTVTGDDIYMATNTSGALLVGDGTNYNPVVMSGDAVISSSGVVTIQADSVALGTDTSGGYAGSSTEGGNALGVPYDGIKSPTTNSGISFSTFNNVWTSTTGTHTWTSAVTSGDAFKYVNTGNMGANTSILKLSNTGNPTGGAVLQIENTDTDMVTIKSNNFTVNQNGKTTIGTTSSAKLTVNGDADEIQTLVKGNATQTSNVIAVQNSAGTNLWTASTAGSGFSIPVTVSGGLSYAIQSTVDNAGWSIVDQTDNQACTTGCTSACMFGQDLGGANKSLVSCSDTTADICACMGAN